MMSQRGKRKHPVRFARWHTISRVLVLFMFLAGVASSSSAAEKKTTTIGGTGAAIGVLKRMALQYERDNPASRVTVLPSMGSSGGIKAVAKGAIDIGIAARPMNRDEKTPALSAFEFARTPFIFVAGKNADVSDLGLEELISICRGDVKIWPNGEHIRLILRPPSEVDIHIARSISPALSEALDIALAREGMLTALTDQENADMLEKIPGSLGLCTLTQIISEKRRLTVLSFNGEIPSVKTLTNGTYPLVKRLYVITKTTAPPHVVRFINFMRSPEGAKILQESGAMAVPLRTLE